MTGGAGFLGSHLCERLLDRGSEVLCLDNFATGSLENVAHLQGREGFKLVDHDINLPYSPPLQPTAVMHLASPASPPAYLALPIETLKVGSIGTMHALDIALEHDAIFFMASTSEVYGDPEVNPQPESYRGSVSTTGPRGVYDEAKRFSEALTMAYHRAHDVDTRIVRIFNTYGPRLSPGDGRVVSNFISQALSEKPITVYGDGSQTRSLCYVDDLIRGFLLLMESDQHEPMNLGNPHELSMFELAELVVKMVDTESRIVFELLPEDDPRVRCPDITKAKSALGWEPEVPLEEGLERTIDWFRRRLGAI